MGWIILWLIMAVVVAIIAASKGKNAFAWGLYGFLIWPIALVHILVTSADGPAIERQAMAAGRVKCLHCAEMIMAEAKVCRFCGRDVPRPSYLMPYSAPEETPRAPNPTASTLQSIFIVDNDGKPRQ